MPTLVTPGPDGLIYTENIEINAVDGCNLRCRACSHASPLLSPTDVADPAEMEKTLTDLARHMRVQHVRVQGGEPLLHPDLIGLLASVRRSGIAERLRLVTNGRLLSKAKEDVWAAIDELQVSIYPGFAPSGDDMEGWLESATTHGVEVRLRPMSKFGEAYSEVGTTDDKLVQRIYDACLVAHVWRAYNVHGGKFYKCPQAAYLPRIRGEESDDGIAITDADGFAADLLRYLNDTAPLSSCQNCLGAVGRIIDHEQVPRRQWRKPQLVATEDMVDYSLLELLESRSYVSSVVTFG